MGEALGLLDFEAAAEVGRRGGGGGATSVAGVLGFAGEGADFNVGEWDFKLQQR